MVMAKRAKKISTPFSTKKGVLKIFGALRALKVSTP